MADFFDVIESRSSSRLFTDEPVSKEDLEKIVYAGQCAPTGMNRQETAFVVVQDPKTVALISKANAAVMGKDIDPFYGAKTVIIVSSSKTSPTYLYDGSIAVGNMLNAAHALGLGACWIHRAKEVFESDLGKNLLKEWGLDESYEGISNVIVGHIEKDMPVKAKTSKVLWK